MKKTISLIAIAIMLFTSCKKEENASTVEAKNPDQFGVMVKKSANIEMVKTFDQADNVARRLSGLGIDFLIAIGLVLFTLLPLGHSMEMMCFRSGRLYGASIR